MSYLIDSDTIDRNGYTYTVEVWADQDADHADREDLDPETLAAYERGDWQYVGVRVTADDYPDAHASIWAVEYGDIAGRTINLASLIADEYMTMTDPLGTEVTTSLVDSLIDEACDLIPSGRKTLTITLAVDSAAFTDYPDELARTLRRLAERIDGTSVKTNESAEIRDTNGNSVGSWGFSYVS